MSEVTPSIINKVKNLLRLTTSPNAHEAEAAKAMASRLIAKYNISQAQLDAVEAAEEPPYGEEERIYSTVGLFPWKQQLVLAVANYFECQVVVEQMPAVDGVHKFSYFAYGDDDQVKDTKFVYRAFEKKVEELILTRCIQRGPIYVESYCEGVVESIRWNIEMDGIEIPEIKKPLRKVEEAAPPTSTTLATVQEDKPSPTDNRTKVNGTLIKDIQAYFRGLDDGKTISLKDVLAIEAESNQVERLGTEENV